MTEMVTARSQPSAGDPVARLSQLVIGHGGKALLPPFDFDIRSGELHLIVGRNGAGKSTLVRTILGLLPPLAGQVKLAKPGLPVAYVPQSAGLDPLLPVRAGQVVAWGRLRGWSFLRPWQSSADHRQVAQAVAAAGATDFIEQPFRTLSGGQKQRVLFARVLASGAELVLLDEPTASMDAEGEREAYELIGGLCERGLAVVVVTHTVGLAMSRASRVLLLDRRDRENGEVVSGSPDQVRHDPRFQALFGVP